MTEEEGNERAELIHALRNAEAEKVALKHFLGKAAERIEILVESDCEEKHKQQAIVELERFRRAAS